MSILMGSDLIERLSFKNDKNYCMIEKVEFWPGIIRVFVDVRGDNSFGALQKPSSSSLGIVTGDSQLDSKSPLTGNISISEESRQYYGYVDFELSNSFLNGDHTIGFQYGASGYSTAKLFHFNKELLSKYRIKST